MQLRDTSIESLEPLNYTKKYTIHLNNTWKMHQSNGDGDGGGDSDSDSDSDTKPQ